MRRPHAASWLAFGKAGGGRRVILKHQLLNRLVEGDSR